MKRISIFTLILLLSLLPTSAFSQKGKPGPGSNTPVTSTIQDSDLNMVPYSIQSDRQGSYKNGVQSVSSIIQGIGDWELDLINFGSSRRVFVSFDQPVASGYPAPPLNGLYPVRFITQCSSNLTNLAAGASQKCPLIVAVNVGSDRYSLRFYSTNFPGSEDVGWTCSAASNGKCVSWKMQSENDGNVAQLLKITTSKGKTVNTSYGFYNFTFSVDLTNP